MAPACAAGVARISVVYTVQRGVTRFVTPALVEWLHMNSPAYTSGAAFLLGLVGMSLAAALLQGIKETPLGKILTGWLSRKG